MVNYMLDSLKNINVNKLQCYQSSPQTSEFKPIFYLFITMSYFF